jgi:hypothetical protein
MLHKIHYYIRDKQSVCWSIQINRINLHAWYCSSENIYCYKATNYKSNPMKWGAFVKIYAASYEIVARALTFALNLEILKSTSFVVYLIRQELNSNCLNVSAQVHILSQRDPSGLSDDRYSEDAALPETPLPEALRHKWQLKPMKVPVACVPATR